MHTPKVYICMSEVSAVTVYDSIGIVTVCATLLLLATLLLVRRL